MTQAQNIINLTVFTDFAESHNPRIVSAVASGNTGESAQARRMFV